MGITISRTVYLPTDPSIPGHIDPHPGSIVSESLSQETPEMVEQEVVEPEVVDKPELVDKPEMADPLLPADLPPVPSGPPVPMPVTPEKPQDYDNDQAKLKLQSHQLKSFNGRSTEFPKWKVHTECVFNGTGYERILVDEEFARTHSNKNTLVYSQLSIAVCDGDASHLVDQHKHTQDGHRAWQDLITFFHGSKRSIRDARIIRNKLGRLSLSEGMTASAYINKFQTWHRDLNDINDGKEGFSEDTKLQAFMENIKHPKYTMAVGCLKNIADLDMATAIDRIRQTETEIETERGEKRKMNVLRRQIYIADGIRFPEEDQDSPDNIPSPPKSGRAKKRRRVDSQANTKLPKEIQLKMSGRIAIRSEIWTELLQSDRDFVLAWNSRSKHNESTKDIRIPTGVTLFPFVGEGGAPNLKRIRRQIQDSKGPTAAMKKADQKRIHFHLTGDADDDELEDTDLDMD
jgi:hypothetical protein